MLHPFQTIDTPFGRPGPRPGHGRLPVTVITGFLGAGKTTLIRALLAREEGRGTALIVNEFGEVGIDDALLRTGGETTVLLGNGCVCCAASSDLQRTLRDLFAERASGRVPPFERVIVETSGLADPSPILQALGSDRTLGTHYALAGVVAVVDAASARATASFAPEWAKQVALADRIVISKSDLFTPEQITDVTDLVASLSPAAPQALALSGEVDPAFLLTSSWAGASFFRADAVLPAEHAEAYRTFAVVRDEPLSWPVFSRAMDTLVSLRGPDLLRVKGLVNVRGRLGPVVVNFVQHLAHPPQELAAWPDEDRRTRLVFITRRLDRHHVVGLLDAVLAVAPQEGAAPEQPRTLSKGLAR